MTHIRFDVYDEEKQEYVQNEPYLADKFKGFLPNVGDIVCLKDYGNCIVRRRIFLPNMILSNGDLKVDGMILIKVTETNL